MGRDDIVSWDGVPVLVTGAGGFIGSHLTERLVDLGARVTAFVRYTSQHEPGLLSLAAPDTREAIEIVPGDLRDPHAVLSAMQDVEVVFHLGALISIPYSYIHPNEVAAVNVMGTVNVLEAARRVGVRRVVHTSTSEVYGTAEFVPIHEGHPLKPQSPYSASKIGADSLAESFGRSFDVPVTIVRPFNTYGPRQSGRAVIPTIIGQALDQDRLSLGALTPTRDFTFVADTVRGFIALAMSSGALGQAVNLGTGTEISIGDLASRICELVGRELPIETSGDRLRPESSEVYRLVADVSRARELAGWKPEVTLDEGLVEVIDFMRRHPGWTSVERYEV